jgi:hypothetical protein
MLLSICTLSESQFLEMREPPDERKIQCHYMGGLLGQHQCSSLFELTAEIHLEHKVMRK